MRVCFITIITLCNFFSLESIAQTLQKEAVAIKNPPKDGHFLSLEKDSVYGAEIYRAYDFVKGKKQKKQVVVAIIDSGCDPEHEDLKNELWENQGEIPNNGIDDDKNGYIDDIHGWNFLGSKNENLIKTPQVGDREYVRLEKKYNGIAPKDVKRKDRSEYEFYLNKIRSYSSISNEEYHNEKNKKILEFAEVFTKEMETKYPGKRFTKEHFKSLDFPDPEKELFKYEAYGYLFAKFINAEGISYWDDFLKKDLELNKKNAARINAKKDSISNTRAVIGDAYYDMKDRFYGNDSLCTIHSRHGTHVAGIVGATKGNGLGIDGVAEVKLMIIRAIPDGDEYDKDVANAIRYAVENGANIINMSFSKLLSPNQKWVSKAMKFAENKGVLLVHAAGNKNALIDEFAAYPVKYITEKKVLSNFITVGSIGFDGKPANNSNYGEKGVDLFAPGVDVYSTVLENKYQLLSGTSMATPVVSGVAALIWSYYPELSVHELKEVILKGVTSRKGEIVGEPHRPGYAKPDKPIEFSKLCSTGGILNAYKAIMLADEMVNK